MSDHRAHLQYVSQRLRPLDRSLPIITAALAAGVDSAQLRDEASSTTAAIQALKTAGNLDRQRLAVNNQPKVAGSFAMSWLHLPASLLQSTPPFGRFLRVGFSVHSFDEAVEADTLGADYVTFGHVFPTQSHPGEPGRGLDALAEIVTRLDIPVLAIGGITLGNLPDVLATGCAGVVVMSAIADQPDPGPATSRLLELIASSPVAPRVPLLPLAPRKVS
jgi:thiamine-phosphate pyrophosphorylase